ncbi:MAG: hypothetical protein JOY80_08510 [Candidatus Dormibacteraeota bacterium]|nr:hypothetical protein [Candidatus Dormibacteraeota bacterium]
MLERWDTSGDRRAEFLHRWAKVTDSVLRGVRNGRFRDGQWILRLLEQTNDYYFITVEPEGDDLHLVTPAAWHAAHDAAKDRIAPLTSVLLGFNAVINNDLPQATADVLRDEWPLTMVPLERRYQDFRIAASIIGAAVPEAEGTLTAWLDDVWVQALMLVTAADAAWCDAIREDIEESAARRAHLLCCDIDGRDVLLSAPADRLARLFPPHHEGASCRVSRELPIWARAEPMVS